MLWMQFKSIINKKNFSRLCGIITNDTTHLGFRTEYFLVLLKSDSPLPWDKVQVPSTHGQHLRSSDKAREQTDASVERGSPLRSWLGTPYPIFACFSCRSFWCRHFARYACKLRDKRTRTRRVRSCFERRNRRCCCRSWGWLKNTFWWVCIEIVERILSRSRNDQNERDANLYKSSLKN